MTEQTDSVTKTDSVIAAIVSGDMVIAGRLCKWCSRGPDGPLVQVTRNGVFHVWKVGHKPPGSTYTFSGIWTRCGFQIGDR